MFKKFLCIYIICVLVITPVSVYASAGSGSLTVASGSGSAVGGLFSDYGVNSKTSAIALTMVLLNSLGTTVKLTDQAIQAGKKVEDVIMDKFAQWVGGSSAESMTEDQREELKKRFKIINGGNGGSDQSSSDGPNIGPDGKVYFGLGALGLLTEFIKFLKSKNDIKTVPVNEGSGNMFNTFYGNKYKCSEGGYTLYTYIENFGNYIDSYLACIKTSSNADHYMFCTFLLTNEPYVAQLFYSGGSGYRRDTLTSSNGFQYRVFSHASVTEVPVGFLDISSYGYYGEAGLKDFLEGNEIGNSPGGVTDDGIYKGENYDDSILDNPDQPLVVDPGLLPNVTTDTDKQVSIPDYLQMILDNLNANASQSQDPYNVPVTDTVTQSPGTLSVPVQQQDPIQQPLPAEVTTPENIPANPVQDPSTPADPSEAFPKLLFPLDEYFPFCIPFDIYALLSKFSADPVAPVFDWSFTEPFSQSVVTVHIDLSMWDSVASAVRVAELGAFIVGLAVVSRKIFTRG